MAIENKKSLVQFNYGAAANAVKTAGHITFASDTREIFVGTGDSAVAFAGNVKDASFLNNVLTLTLNNQAEPIKLDFSDVASAQTTQSLLSSLRDSINENTTKITNLSTAVDSSIADLTERIEDLESDDTANSKVAKVESAVENNVVIFAQGGEVKDLGVKIGGEALAETADASTLATEKAVKDALKTVADNAVVGVSADATNLIYTITQGGTTVGTINIPKDMVVESGSVVTNPEGKDEGTYIKLVLKNVDEPLYINVSDLIEYVTSGSDAGDMVVINVSDEHKVTATITDGTITKAKLDASVQASLGKADTAVQSVVEGSVNGTILVDGSAVSVHGLGSAAYTDATAYDVAGAAAKIKVNGQAQDENGAIVINGADILVGGTTDASNNTVEAELASLRAAIGGVDGATLKSFTVKNDSSVYAESTTTEGAVNFGVKIVDVSVASTESTGLADAYQTKSYVDHKVSELENQLKWITL